MHNKNEKPKPKVSSIKRKQKKQNQKVVLQNENEISKLKVSFSFNHPKNFFETVKKRKNKWKKTNGKKWKNFKKNNISEKRRIIMYRSFKKRRNK